MTAKEYLQQIYVCNRRMKRIQETREQLRIDMYSIGSPMGNMSSDRVQTSTSGDKFGRMIARVDKLERDLVKEHGRMLALKDKIIRQIEAMNNEQQRSVLYNRYVLLHDWETIAEDMNYTTRRIYQIHGEALLEFRKKYFSVFQ